MWTSSNHNASLEHFTFVLRFVWFSLRSPPIVEYRWMQLQSKWNRTENLCLSKSFLCSFYCMQQSCDETLTGCATLINAERSFAQDGNTTHLKAETRAIFHFAKLSNRREKLIDLCGCSWLSLRPEIKNQANLKASTASGKQIWANNVIILSGERKNFEI